MTRLIRYFFGILAAFFMIAGSASSVQSQQTGRQDSFHTLPFHPDSVKIEGELDPFHIDRSVRKLDKNLYELKLTLTSAQTVIPPEFTVKWRFPSNDLYAFWNSKTGVDKVNFFNSPITSRAARNMPVLAYLNHADQNRFTFAISDALRKVEIDSYIKEEDAHVHNAVTFFSEKVPERNSYSVRIRFDLRDIRYEKALNGVARWWSDMNRYKPASIPDQAMKPVYSTWYNFHQVLDPDTLMRELRKARSLGFETVIVDDGWQTTDMNRGYDYTGDWKPEGIPDMKAFVEQVHSLGMDIMLWYSVPFVGKNADNFDRFKGKYLREGLGGAYVLDPRYPGVRRFLINTYVDALKKWNIDGFKLDFIGWFTPVDSTRMTATGGRDYASVNRAVDRLMTDIMNRLKSENEDIMIEFRQPYIGPLMRKYGNMFRAVDAPNMEVLNRARIANLRLMADSTAVHSDMYMWHPSESVESAARQLLNTLFAVPQLSVRLKRLPDDHLKMVEFWTKYQKNYSMVLMDAEFRAHAPGSVYPLLEAQEKDHTIYGLYEPVVISQEEYQPNIHVANATTRDEVTIDFGYAPKAMIYQVYTPTGEEVRTERVDLEAGVHQFEVPESGMLKIKDF
mgnify:CR=1 FL=1